ncbi:hypothetical protein BU14_0614s0006 [Porphyra umbilicalis]|uniref:COX assembly mitochondrial protein n=1 Tax=Porphyra umbilicalis TaxID=2786 RepID=A0A1X6NQY8_PORUM|nr:hypothetical protein BU14_0614s0006 [Porphyra umbilicalis]|eukprot:OSX71031.1 hypothetical protein BU14_0614s0006 [Porphyra umbilicalis]
MTSTPAPAPGAVPVLKRRSENRVRENVKKEALKHCDGLVKEFVDCTKAHTLSVVWACRTQQNALNDCLGTVTRDEAVMNRARAAFAAKFPMEVVRWAPVEDSPTA